MAMKPLTNFVLQQVFEILLRDPVDYSIVAYLSDIKTSGLTNEVTMVYPQGGRGNVRIGRGFAHSRHATLNIESATFNMDVLAAQNGTQVVTGKTTRTKYVEVPLVTGQKTYTIDAAYKATDDAHYVDVVYFLTSDGTKVGSVTEDSNAASGKFTYTTSITQGTITLDETDVSKFMGTGYLATKIAMAYDVETGEDAAMIHVEAGAVPDTVLVSVYGIASDKCTGKFYKAQIEGRAQIDGNWSFDVSADGDPAVHALSLEFLKDCSSSDLYTFMVFTE